MELPPEMILYKDNLGGGFKGERKLDAHTKRLGNNHLIVNDLCLELNNSYFQIDALIISNHKIGLYEVKNYAGSYFYQNGNMVKHPDFEIDNPFSQLEKCVRRLKQLLAKWRINIAVEGKVVFVDESFCLYQAPLDKNMLFLSELEEHFRKLEQSAAPLQPWHLALAEKLAAHHQDYPALYLPPYSLDGLRKGLSCDRCRELEGSLQERTCICSSCGHKERLSATVIRHAEELQLLFPENSLNTRAVYEWCGKKLPMRTIRRQLLKEYQRFGTSSDTIFKK